MKDVLRAFLLASKDMFQPKILWLSLFPLRLTTSVWAIILLVFLGSYDLLDKILNSSILVG
jgi:hypothetical protein